MKYLSTRGSGKVEDAIGFESAVLNGLAPEGGLYIPTEIPQLDEAALDKLRKLSGDFSLLAVEIFSLYINESEISREELKELATRSYATFHHPEVTPVVQLPAVESDPEAASNPLYLLELFHGPTFAFKDVALQFLGNLFEFFLKRKNAKLGSKDEPRHRLTVVGATSGDTGGAAIYGLRNKEDVEVFILHPRGKVSPIQEAQMTMVLDSNVHNVSLPGHFDDCQVIVKKLFGTEEFRNKYQLGAVNSINWARILAQTVYYFKAYFSLENKIGKGQKVIFSVPTGNFGDILAGHYARQMGLPIERLIIATNQNDILTRVFKAGAYSKDAEQGVQPTHSPAMDILVSSNFERLLWYLANTGDASQACATLSKWMNEFTSTGKVQLPEAALSQLRSWFSSYSINDSKTVDIIHDFYTAAPRPYLLDPHTAVGVGAALELKPQFSPTAIVCLATAHPAKFQSAVQLATQKSKEDKFDFDVIMGQGYLPLPFREWMNPNRPRRCHRLASAEPQAVQDLIASVLKR